MKKNILQLICVLFIFSSFSLNAQVTYEMQCEMTVEEIALAQPYDIDHAKQEKTTEISNSLIAELNNIYDKLNNNLPNDIDEHVQTIDAAIISANEIGMNYSMFSDDLEFIATLE